MSKWFLNSPRGRHFKNPPPSQLHDHTMMTPLTEIWLFTFPRFLCPFLSELFVLCCFNDLFAFRFHHISHRVWTYGVKAEHVHVYNMILSWNKSKDQHLQLFLLQLNFTGRAAPAVFRLLAARSFIHIHAGTQKSSQLIEYLFQFSLIREENLLEKHPKFKVPLEVTVILPSRKTP